MQRPLVLSVFTALVAVIALGCSKQLPTQSSAPSPRTGVTASTEAVAPLYTMRDLGVLSGGVFSSGVSISPAGVISGRGNKADGTYSALRWTNGKIADLGSLGGGSLYAGGANDAGQVAGTSYLAGGGWRAFCYYGGSMKNLGKLSGFNSEARGISATGLVVGTGDLLGGRNRGFTYQVGTSTALKQLGTLGGNHSAAAAVNDAGLVVGQSGTTPAPGTDYDGVAHACSWQNGVIKDLGSFASGTGTSAATAVSSNGLIAGWSTGAGNHAVIFGAIIKDLGTVSGFVSSRATGINAAGTVVGLLTNGKYQGNSTRAFIYRNGVIDNIANHVSNLGGYTIIQLNAINDAGAIVGVALVPSSEGYGSHAILLTPQ